MFKRFHSFFFTFCILVISLKVIGQCSQNLITNGDFENGLVGFTVPDHNYDNQSDSGCVLDGFYTVSTHADCFPWMGVNAWQIPTDHSGQGSFLSVNMRNNNVPDSFPVIYCTTVQTQIGQNYMFSFWGNVPNIGGEINPTLDLRINGVAQNVDMEFLKNVGWQNYQHLFTANSTSTELCIYQYTAHPGPMSGGHDVAIDDVCLIPMLDSAFVEVNSTTGSTTLCPGDSAIFTFNMFDMGAPYTGNRCYEVDTGSASISYDIAHGQTVYVQLFETTTFDFYMSNCGNLDYGGSITFDVQVDQNIDPTFTSSDICEGLTNTITSINQPNQGLFSLVNASPPAIVDQNTGIISMGQVGQTYALQYAISSANQCQSYTHVQQVEVLPSESALFIKEDFCISQQSDVQILGTPNGIFSFYQPTPSASISQDSAYLTGVLPGELYYIQYITQGQCPDTLQDSVLVFEPVDAGFVINDFCEDSVILPVPNVFGGSYSLLGSTSAQINSVSGALSNYQVDSVYQILYTIGSCDDTSSVRVQILRQPQALLSGSGNLCDSISDSLFIEFQGTAPFQIDYLHLDQINTLSSINDSQIQIFINAVDTITGLTITDQNCSNQVFGQAFFTASGLSFSVDTVSTCFDSPNRVFEIDNTNIDQSAICLWNFGDGNTANGCQAQTHVYSTEDCFDVGLQVISNSGCQGEDFIYNITCLHDFPEAQMNIYPEFPTYVNNTIELFDESSDEGTVSWFVDSNFIALNKSSTTFELDVQGDTSNICMVLTDLNSCKDTVCERLVITGHPVIYLPNTFTPNQDFLNEEFQLVHQHIKTVDFKIYNRWGNRVYETQNLNVSWNGLFNGKLVGQGVYLYELEYTTVQDKVFNKTGTINVIY